MSAAERALRSNCPTLCPCLCHDMTGGPSHPNQKCADAQEDWHYAYLGMEYRHAGRKDDCDDCANWKLPVPPLEAS